MSLRISLSLRIFLAFAFVILLAVVILVTYTGRTTEQLVGRFFSGGMAGNDQIVTALAEHYTSHGSWTGIDSIIDEQAAKHESGILLTDPIGRIIYAKGSGGHFRMGMGFKISVHGIPVGIVYIKSNDEVTTGNGYGMMGPGIHSPPRQELIESIRTSSFTAMGIAALAALLFSLVLSRQISVPARRMEEAARGFAAGDMSRRVPVQGGAEMERLAEAFNNMADGLSQAEEARANMMADIAHELRTPLTVLQGNLEAMRDGLAEPTKERIAALYAETSMLSSLIDELRDLSLAEAGELSLEKSAVELGAFLGGTIEEYREKAAVGGKTLALEESAPVRAEIDVRRMTQVVRNLLNNALEHTGEGGIVKVMLAGSPTEAVISVQDTGVGIAASELPQIFDRFYRGRSGVGREGSGIGLAVARRFVEAHGGTIGAESEPGVGSTFTVRLPRA